MQIVNFFDLETTGLNEPEERIIEVCAKLYNLDTEEHLETYLQRINPERKIGAKAAKVHKIKNEDVENEPIIEDVAADIERIFGLPHFHVAHNGDWFDFPFLTREMQRIGRPINLTSTFDTMVEARWATSLGKNPRLGELATCLDIEYNPDEAHAAEYDVDVMAKCFFTGRRLGYYGI